MWCGSALPPPGSPARLKPTPKPNPPRTKRTVTRPIIGALCSVQKQPDPAQDYFGLKDVACAASSLFFYAGSIKKTPKEEEKAAKPAVIG